MSVQSDTLDELVKYFSSLPSIGRKTATRLVYHILRQNPQFASDFGTALSTIHSKVLLCNSCYNFTETDPCGICSDPKRKTNKLLIVEQPSDVTLIERTREFKGRYHVLHGVLNPLEGIGPQDLKLRELISRMAETDEVIIALNPTVEGEVTAQYLSKMIKPLDVKVRKIASGIPMGHQLEFSDDATLARAIHGATEL